MFKKLSDILDLKSTGGTSKSNYKGRVAGESFNFLALIHRWPDIVGPKLSQVTIPLKNQNNTLTILTEHPAYSQSLSFLEETLKKKIYQVFPELKDKIRRFYFNVSSEHFNDQRANLIKRSQSWAQTSSMKTTQNHPKKHKIHPHNPEFRKLKIEADQYFNDMNDEEMKEALVSLYIQLRI
jgi:hypothetical protein